MAENQYNYILEYWYVITGNTKYSKKISRKTKRAIKTLQEFPESGSISKYYSLRKSALGDYTIYYKISGNNIEIVTFWDNRQDPQKLYELLNK